MCEGFVAALDGILRDVSAWGNAKVVFGRVEGGDESVGEGIGGSGGRLCLCGWGVEVCVGVWKCWGRNIRKQVMRWIVVSHLTLFYVILE